MKIAMILQWFGPWPAWQNLFYQSCRYNPGVDFIIVTDRAPTGREPPNVRLIHYTRDAYISHVSDKLKIRLDWNDAYKLVDLKPLLGFLHAEHIAGHDFWGFGDTDVIYGNILKFLPEEELRAHRVISTHDHIVAGHFTLVENSEEMRNVFRKALHWKPLIRSKKHKSFDERIFSMMFAGDAMRRKHGVHRLLVPKLKGALLREQFSTFIPGLTWIDGTQNFPREWHWREGTLTADNAPDREFMYCHFTYWASRRWSGGKDHAWAGIEPLVKLDDDNPLAFRITPQGFLPLQAGRDMAEAAHG